MNYQEAVAEFRRLDDEIEADRWRQAEIVWEQHIYGQATLTAIATDTGKHRTHIAYLVRLWAGFGTVRADSRPSFTDAYRMAETGEETPEAASAIKNANRAASALGQLPARSRAQIIREHLADPKVADEVMANREARSGAIAAVSRIQEREDLTRTRPEPRPAEADPEQEMILTLVDFRRVQRVLTEITQRLQHSLLLRTNTDYQDAVLAQVAWDRNALDLIEIVANGGQTTDEELAQILEGS